MDHAASTELETRRTSLAAGEGAVRRFLEASLDRGCETCTGDAVTKCRKTLVQEKAREFRERAAKSQVVVMDATHCGMEKPPQLAMVR